MNVTNVNEKNTRLAKNPKADLEMTYIKKYLQERGFLLRELVTLPEEEATKLRIEAAQYASFKLEELESRARLLTRIQDATDSS